MNRRTARGFTLIELMIVVAIIGLLSSIAIPSFRLFQLRAKQAERIVVMTAIQRGIDEYWTREGKFPLDFGGGQSLLYLAYWNPDAAPKTGKRPWRIAPINVLDHWNRLSITVQGSVYYSYYGYAQVIGTSRYYYLQALGDLDGDTIQNRYEEEWSFSGTTLQLWGGGTASCAYCTRAFETNPRTF